MLPQIKLTLLLLCMGISTTQAQKVCIVADKQSKQAIAYATVYTTNAGRSIYVTTDKQGAFAKEAFNGQDTLAFRALSYEHKQLPFAALKDTVYLMRKSYNLGYPVATGENRATKTIDNFTNKKNKSWGAGSVGMEWATKIDFAKEDSGTVKKITHVGIKMKIKDETHKCRLHLYEANPDGTVGEELLTKNIFITPEDIDKKLYLRDLTYEYIFTTAEAVFVGYESLGNIYHVDDSSASDLALWIRNNCIYMTTYYPKQATYTRTPIDKSWHVFAPIHSDEKDRNPTNMQVMVKYR